MIVEPTANESTTNNGSADGRRARGDQSRQAVLVAAQGAFGELGYEATSVEIIAFRANVTKGSLYHHFADKRALFEAVLERVQRMMVVSVGRAAQRAGSDPLLLFEKAIGAYLDASQDHVIARIVLVDGPVVLGDARWEAIDSTHWGAQLRAAVDALAGPSVRRPVREALAVALNGAIGAAAKRVSADPTTRPAAMAALRCLARGIAQGRG